MVLWPLAIGTASLLGLNWQASRELASDLGDSGQRRRPIPWLLVLLGAVGGLWIGVTWAPQIKKACSIANILLSSPEDEDQGDVTDEDERFKDKRLRHNKSRRS